MSHRAGIARVRVNVERITEDIAGRRTSQAVRASLLHIGATSDMMVPMDTGFLINSRFAPEVDRVQGGTRGRVGYLAHYAAAVHNAPGTLKGLPREHFGRTGNQSSVGPVRPYAFGGGTGKGNYWDPAGEPKFLAKAGEQVLPMLPALLARYYRV